MHLAKLHVIGLFRILVSIQKCLISLAVTRPRATIFGKELARFGSTSSEGLLRRVSFLHSRNEHIRAVSYMRCHDSVMDALYSLYS